MRIKAIGHRRTSRGHTPSALQRSRPAVVLLIVLVAVVILSLAAYTFKDLMQTNKQAVRVNGQQIQTRMLVDSGVEHMLQYLRLDEASRLESGGHYDNPLYFQAMTVALSDDPSELGSFTILSPYEGAEGSSYGVRYGLEDESARLNLSIVLLADQVQEGASRELLMALPNMTEDVADAILDWIDEDEEPREFGAELEYYGSLVPAYAPRNGPLQTVEELLLVRGVYPELLFGADANRNGMADPHEISLSSGGSMAGGPAGTGTSAAGSLTASAGGSADALSTGLPFDRGWSAQLTLHSSERNLNATGEPRIFLNTDDMQQLHDDLSAVFDTTWADFIVAYRIYGPAGDDAEASGGQPELELDLSQSPTREINQVLDLIGAKVQIGGGGGGGSNGDSQGESDQQSGGGQSGGGRGGGGRGGDSRGGESGGRGGDDDDDDDDDNESTVIESPFSDDLGAMATYLTTLMDNCTVVEDEAIPGRINVNVASPELLSGIPGITDEIVDAILNSRELVEEGDTATRDHETWLLAEGLVTLEEMKSLQPFMNAGGDVFRAQVVGYFQGGGPSSRIEVIIDATGSTPRIVFWRDISHLGRGHSRATLGSFDMPY